MTEETIYGKKKIRNGRFLIVAPHGAGDDLKSGVISIKLANLLGGSFVINNKYKKPSNHQIKDDRLVEDFNRLKWSFVKQNFLWNKKVLAMKAFYSDVAEICDKIKMSTGKKAVVVYIHSMQNKKVGIDVGTGLRPQGSRLFGSGFHDKTGNNTGEVTIKISHAKKIIKELDEELKIVFGLSAAAGDGFSGWSKWSGIQFHKHEGRNDYALQFEINEFLRSDKEKIKQTAELLAKILKNVFLNK